MTHRARVLTATLLVLALVVPAATASGQAPAAPDDTEIIGGQPADPGEYPFQVGLLRRSVGNRFNAQFCGGSLISPDTVLTAAHCLDGLVAAEIDVLVGTHTLAEGGGGTRLPARRIRMHPRFNPDTFANDVGIIQLGGHRNEELIATVQPGQNALWAPGTIATVIGWGNRATSGPPDYPFVLWEVELPILSDTQCAQAYGGDYLAGQMLCAGDLVAGGLDSCQGDSGGPFIVPDGPEWLQVGIVSWGRGCGQADFPGVYTRLASYAGFVNPYLDPDSAPNPVTGLRAQRASSNAFLIGWQPPAFDGGTRITRYRVSIPSLGRVQIVPGNRPFAVVNLPRGPRRIEVQAVNAVGTSAARAINVNA